MLLWTFIVFGIILTAVAVGWVYEFTRLPDDHLEWVYERERLLEALRRLDDD